MRVHEAHHYKVTTRRRGQRKDRERRKEKAVCQTAAISLLSREWSSIPEIGQKSNRVVDVNGDVAGVDPGRRGIQQICSLTSGLARSSEPKEGEENPNDSTEQKNSSNYVYLSRIME